MFLTRLVSALSQISFAALLLTLFFSLAACAEEKKNNPANDPMPKGALARYGSSRLMHGRSVHGLVFSRDGKRLASCSDDFTARIWEVPTGRELLTTATSTSRLVGVDLSSDGKLLSAASYSNGVWAWDAHAAKQLYHWRTSQKSLAFSPDSKHLLVGGGPFHTLDARSGKPVEGIGFEGRAEGMQFSADGRWLAIADTRQVSLMKLEAQKQKGLLRPVGGADLFGASGSFGDLALFADGRVLAALASGSEVHVRDAAGEHNVRIKEDEGEIVAVALSPDGRRLYTGERR